MILNVYFKKNGLLCKKAVDGFVGDIKIQLEELKISGLREVVDCDKNSPVMVVVK